MIKVGDEVVQGLMIGIALAAAARMEKPFAVQPRHVAWFLANQGFGLSYAVIGQSHILTPPVSKQAVMEVVARIGERCEDRRFERQMTGLAETFGVSL